MFYHKKSCLRADISKEAGYDSDSYWYGMSFPISLDERNAMLRKLTIDCDQLQLGAETVLKLRSSAGTELYRRTFSYARIGRKTKKVYLLSKRAENCRLEIDNRNGWSSTTTIAIITRYSIVPCPFWLNMVFPPFKYKTLLIEEISYI